MSVFNEHQFEKRLQLLKDSQESIQSLSGWCLQHRQHHKKIVACWLRILKKVKIEHRLTLFYLANDVIQYSKRKNYEYVESWGTALQRATTMVREERVKQRILRIFKIWDERGIYDEAFIADLSGLLSTTTKKTSNESVAADTSDFQPPVLIAKIRSCKKLEDDTDLKLKRLNESHLSFSDADALRSHLKDRRQGDDIVAEVDEGLSKMQGFVRALELEIKERNALIELLEHADSFYETQKGEAKVVANAYRNFGSRVKNLKRRLDDLVPTLKEMSPIPSPDVNAPSPSPDSDIELPGENENTGLMGNSFFSSFNSKAHPIKTVLQDEPQPQQQQHSVDNCFTSFMGNTSLPFDIQKSLFNETSTEGLLSPSPVPVVDDPGGVPLLSTLPPSEGKPIEVISSRTKPDEGFNITEFLKSLIPSGGSPIIPGLNVDPPPQSTLPQTTPKSIYSPTAELSTTDQYDYSGNTASTPLQPPPLPPNLFPLEGPSYKYEQSVGQEEDAWNTKLPPKFPTWGDTVPGWEREESDKRTEWIPVMPPNKVPPLSLDTPESPPLYEKEGFSDPVEYDDSVVEPALMSSSGDVDHRTLVQLPQINHTKDTDCRMQLPLKHMKDTDHRLILPVTTANHTKKDMDHRPMIPRKKDVDHRNLISLTGSPVRDHSTLPPPPVPPSLNWSHSDQDYRSAATASSFSKKEMLQQRDQDYRLHQPHSVVRRQLDETQDNVESVDMEMSDEEMLDDIAGEKKELVTEKDNGFEMSQINKPVISFNINSHSKVLANSPLNEVKEDPVRSRSRVYGCQRIPTISGIGGNTHSARGMGPRPRVPLLVTPSGVKRLPPPNLPRGFRPSMMPPPPPLPPLPHMGLLPQPESFNVTIEIKPQSEIESHSEVKDSTPCVEFTVEEEVTTELIPPPPLPPPPPPPLQSKTVIVEEEKPTVQVNSKMRQWTANPDAENETAEVDLGISVTENVQDETAEDSLDNKEEESTEENVGQDSIATETEPVARAANEPVVKRLEIHGSEHWMNNELAELEQLDMGRMEQDRGQRGRGRPFGNFPRGGFIPRARPMWNGPRRGGPPVRFPFRPPLDRPFGRAHRGGFRPFRGNRGHFGGW